MSSYKYNSIEEDKHAFRLLVLFRGEINEPIKCELCQARLPQNEYERTHELMEYFALSYTWGAKDKAREITMNGCATPITENLFSALRHLRSREEHQYLWADAICIDQDNPDERSHQVGNMRHIYKEAVGVYVWLGNGTPLTDIAMDAMVDVQKIKRDHSGDWIISGKFHIERKFASKNENEDGEIDDNASASQVRAGLADLLSRPWFRRIWILQEIASSRMARIFCGKKAVSAQIFAQFPRMVGLTPNEHCQAVLDIMPGLSRVNSWWSEKRDLLTLLKKFKRSRCTEERDMIYALVGISEDACNREVFTVDYRPETTIQEVVQYAVNFIFSYGKQVPWTYGSLGWNMTDFLGNLHSLDAAAVYRTLAPNQQEIFQLMQYEVTRQGRTHRLIPSKWTDNSEIFQARWELFQWAAKTNYQPILQLLWADYENRWLGPFSTLSYLVQALKDGYEHEAILVIDHVSFGATGTDCDGRTLLSHAAEHGSMAMIEKLCQISENNSGDPLSGVESVDRRGRTPISYAAENGHTDLVRLLVQKGADLWRWNDICHDYYVPYNCSRRRKSLIALRDTPLSYALKRGHMKLVGVFTTPQAVMENYLGQFHRQEEYESALLFLLDYAGSRGVVDLMRLLTTWETPAGEGDTFVSVPLFAAAKYGHTKIIELLIHESDYLRRTLGDHSLPYGAVWFDFIKQNHRTALSCAAEHGHADVVMLLINRGADVNGRDFTHRTALSYAAENGHVDIVKLLIKRRVDANAWDVTHRTALLYAVENGHFDILQVLGDARADVNIPDWNGQTPLMRAVSQNRTGMIKYLLRKNARVDQVDGSEKTSEMHRLLDWYGRR